MNEVFKPAWVGLDRNETRWAKKRFDDYQLAAHIDSFSDCELLEELVKREALQERTWKTSEAIAEKSKEIDGKKSAAPKYLIEDLNNNLEQILILKEKLGLSVIKKEDFLEQWKKILSQVDLYVNQGENDYVFHFKCPDCGRMTLLRKDLTQFIETIKHPFFTDGNLIYNKRLFKLLDEKKITEEDVAVILDCHPQFVEKTYKDIYLKEKSMGLV